MLFDPLAVAGEKIVSVVEPLPPVLTWRDEEPNDADQPDGTPALRLKVELAQAELSLLVTDTVYLTELPAGKILGWFDRTDLFRAKEIIGDKMCIMGGMPGSLLRVGTPEQVKKLSKQLIDEVGKNGGFIMASNTPLDYADPELVKVWVDITREYGVYR